MSRLILILVAVLLVVGGLGVAWLTLLPPQPRPERIERPVPIDRGQAAPAPATPAPATPPAPLR